MFEDKTPESIKVEILGDISLADTREGSYTNELVSPTALELWKLYDSLKAILPIVFVDETSGEYIDKMANRYGIVRKAGTKAVANMLFTGTDGTVIPKGTVFLTTDGLQFVTADAVVITAGVASTTATAIDVGEAYNVPAGTITQQIVSISGLATASNEVAVGGTDPESDESLVNRLYAYLQKPASSGNVYHYEQWALEVDGVGAVKVVPLWDGAGTVRVLIVGPNKGPVDALVVANCAEHIEQYRPIGADVTVISAEGLEINVSATVELESTTTKAIVQAELTERLTKYLHGIAFEKYEVVYNRIAYMLLDIDGVVDYTTLTVNGETDNIFVEADQVPVAGTVVIN